MEKVKMDDKLLDYFNSKLDSVSSLTDIQLIEDSFYENVEFDERSYPIVSRIAKEKLVFTALASESFIEV
jgi:hypothetical protein